VRIEVLHIGGPVPVKREGVIEVSALPAAARGAITRAVDAVRAEQSEAPASPVSRGKQPAPRPPPDVGGCTISVVDDGRSVLHLSFSDADATPAQALLLKALRPFLKVVPWK
jgi:hypothetical protein